MMLFGAHEHFCLKKAGLKVMKIIMTASRISTGMQMRRMILMMREKWNFTWRYTIIKCHGLTNTLK